MLSIAPLLRRLGWFGIVLLAVLLTACGSPTVPEAAPIAYLGTVPIDADARVEVVEARYGGRAVLFKPDAGFAVLGFSEDEAALTPLSDLDTNTDAVGVVDTRMQAAGWTAWAGGWTAWAGGWTAWAGGVAQTFEANKGAWDQIGLARAHARATHLGAGVKVAVIDSGLDLDHPAFTGRLAPAAEWRDWVDGDTVPEEGVGHFAGHGTAAAGIILQVAPEATLLPLRVLAGDGSGDLDSVVQAIDHAVQMGADVINLSLGASTGPASLEAVLRYAAEQGVFMTASAGNEALEQITYPASWGDGDDPLLARAIVGVGSVGPDNVRSGFSNIGWTLDLVAPGEGIVTTFPDALRGTATGTSFAAPMAAGALALALAEPASSFNLDPAYRADTARNLEVYADGPAAAAANATIADKLGEGVMNVGDYIEASVPLLTVPDGSSTVVGF